MSPEINFYILIKSTSNYRTNIRKAATPGILTRLIFYPVINPFIEIAFIQLSVYFNLTSGCEILIGRRIDTRLSYTNIQVIFYYNLHQPFGLIPFKLPGFLPGVLSLSA